MTDELDHPTGFKVLNSASLNKGTAFTSEERDKYKLHGLLPPTINTPESQLDRALKNMRRKYYDIERYVFLKSLQGRNERLFYKLVINNIEEVMPLIYTPTVGQACNEFGRLFRRPRGMYLSLQEKGHIKEVMENWPYKDIRVIVVTDGERILGLGDLGANGMGISIGKLALYVACAGIHPSQCLPVMLDVGTNNEEYLKDDLYLGLHQKRVTGDEYYEFVDEFIQASRQLFTNVLIQFEDFLTPRAYTLMNKYKNETLCFNDDIQGTAGVALAGLYASTRISDIPFSELRILFLGAGSAATGIADLICYALQKEGLSDQQARERLWFVDKDGLLVNTRQDISEHNLPYLVGESPMSFSEAVEYFKPHVLIGATGSPGTFSQEVIEQMARINSRPTIFALSNPTSHAECTAEQAYSWSNGRAIFASGSPFDEVQIKGEIFKPGQGNNAYIFPGIGLGAVVCNARLIDDDVFLVAARELAKQVSEEDLARGTLYPPLNRIREISINIAEVIINHAYEYDLAQLEPKPEDVKEYLLNYMYDPTY
ncbi:MAG: NAD-dependent malic enzyme [Gammaproteobacteria bacterium]|nr:NAD-dependent malic enzyme [Gammaproteobacteria bacterium]